MKRKTKPLCFVISIFCLAWSDHLFGQNTSIKGFVESRTTLEKNKVSFGLGEQDLFITSEISERFSFLGETVFRFDPSSRTQFGVSIERIVLKYNIKGNHNILAGKHHTPVNYWNDTYHHGRLFFPTIDRPMMFESEIIPLHTTGISFQGHSLGKLRFGYDLMIGNGIGSSDVLDNDNHKSLTAAIHIKPAERLRIGLSYYKDLVSEGATHHEMTYDYPVDQNLFSGSVAYFGRKYEFLAEATAAKNTTDSTGNKVTLASYVYGGYRIGEKLVPYFRVDNLNYQDGELYYSKNNGTSIVVGARYEINFLAVVKLEFQHLDHEFEGTTDKLTAQLAIGF
jgi:hypothetical protein